jgi:hypothetical protein
VLAIGVLIVSYLGIIMKKTHSLIQLQVVIEAIFTNEIFCLEATKMALYEVYTKFILSEQRLIFLPWRILRAINLCMAGSLN